MDKGTIIRVVVFLAAWGNQLLVSKGYESIPGFDENNVSLVITLVVSIYAALKHNFFGKKGAEQKAAIEAAKK